MDDDTSSTSSSPSVGEDRRGLDALADAVEHEDAEAGLDAKQRALWRFKAGTPNWRYFLYKADAAKRRTKTYQITDASGATKGATYNEFLEWRWKQPHSGDPTKTNGEVYNEARKRKREEAVKRMVAAGLQVRGRPRHSYLIQAVPQDLTKELSEEQLVILGKPNMFENIGEAIPVPHDLVEYMGREDLIIDKRPLNWPMFVFNTWSELEPATRRGYSSNARLALKGDVGYILSKTADYVDEPLVRQHLLYDAIADRYVDKLEADAKAEKELLGEEEEAALVAEELVLEEKTKKAKLIKLVFTQNPIRIVEFMLAARDGVGVDPFHIVRQWKDSSISMANSRASGLASVCYAWLRLALDRKENKTPLFKKVLDWSIIFSRFTTVAKKATGAAHASQMTSEEKRLNTVEWPTWNKLVKEFLNHYLIIKNQEVSVRPLITPKRKAVHKPRERIFQLETGELKEFKPKGEADLPPWLRSDYPNEPRAPNLRELRDCAMAACYGLMAPVRLDWATVSLMDEAMFASFMLKKKLAIRDAADGKEIVALNDKTSEKKQDAVDPTALLETAEDQGKKKKEVKSSRFDKNILVIDSLKNPQRVVSAWFGQMKNKRYFAHLPVQKMIHEETPDSPLACNILLAYLQARAKVNFDSMCLFPFNTYMSEDLKPDLREQGKRAVPFCFSNGAFGERLADFAWDLTGKNFTETLMRRSYITNYWKSHSALKEYNWTRLLVSVHQTSKSANLGYIKDYDKELEEWIARVKPTVAANMWKETLEAEQYKREQAIIEKEGHLADPEMDPAAVQEAITVKEGFAIARKQQDFALERRGKEKEPMVAKETEAHLEAAKKVKPQEKDTVPELPANIIDPPKAKVKVVAQPKLPTAKPIDQPKLPSAKPIAQPKAPVKVKVNAKALLAKPKDPEEPQGLRRSLRERKVKG
jgi:hypothetical protein